MPTALRRIAFALLFAAGLASPIFMGIGFRHYASASVTELGRFTSPDLRYDAVILERRPALKLMHAATEVYVVQRGHTVGPRDSAIMTATRAQGVKGAWRGDRLLEIRYSQARVDGFTAVWPPKWKTTPDVEIRLIPPAGGASFSTNDAS